MLIRDKSYTSFRITTINKKICKNEKLISVGTYGKHDGFENIYVSCPEGYTTAGTGSTNPDNCTGKIL